MKLAVHFGYPEGRADLNSGGQYHIQWHKCDYSSPKQKALTAVTVVTVYLNLSDLISTRMGLSENFLRLVRKNPDRAIFGTLILKIADF